LHAGLAQSTLPDSISGNLKNTFPQKWQNKPSWGCWEGAFQLPEHHSSLLLIFQNRLVKYAWVSSSRRPQETPCKHYTKSPTASTIVISTHALPSSPSWHKIQKQMEATSIYTKLPIYYDTKEITISSSFILGRQKQAID